MEFSTEVDIEIIGDNWTKAGGGKATVKWKLDLELREWGVKGFNASVPDQKVTCNVTRYNEITDEEYEEEITLDVKNVQVRHTDDFDFKYDELMPTKLELYGGGYQLYFY